MQAVGEGRLRARAVGAGLAMVALALAGCSGSGTSNSTGSVSTTTTTVLSAATNPPGSTASVGAVPSSSTTSTLPTFAAASDGPRSAPGEGTGTALLRAVRVGSNSGFERIVFEFAGAAPGYRIAWVKGPITADASGLPVSVKGAAYLRIILSPASGIDPSNANAVYTGPDRIPVAAETTLITDLVRTGDFEAVLSWVAGATKRVPFRVLTLTAPTRLVIDLQTTST